MIKVRLCFCRMGCYRNHRFPVNASSVTIPINPDLRPRGSPSFLFRYIDVRHEFGRFWKVETVKINSILQTSGHRFPPFGFLFYPMTSAIFKQSCHLDDVKPDAYFARSRIEYFIFHLYIKYGGRFFELVLLARKTVKKSVIT